MVECRESGIAESWELAIVSCAQPLRVDTNPNGASWDEVRKPADVSIVRVALAAQAAAGASEYGKEKEEQQQQQRVDQKQRKEVQESEQELQHAHAGQVPKQSVKESGEADRTEPQKVSDEGPEIGTDDHSALITVHRYSVEIHRDPEAGLGIQLDSDERGNPYIDELVDR